MGDLGVRSGGRGPTSEGPADAGIVDLLGRLDDAPPDPRSLYYRWESEQWEAGALAFAKDRSSWSALAEDERASMGVLLGCFLVPSGRIGDLLVPFVDAVPSEEEQVFLTSQLVDEARAVVFCDRLSSELPGDDSGSVTALIRTNDQLGTLLDLVAPRADEVRVDRNPGPALFEGLLLLNVLLDGVLAASSLRRLGPWLEERGGFPGLLTGLSGLARDTTRHAHFGIRLLQEALADVSRSKSADASKIEATIEEALPSVQGVVNEAAARSNDFSGLPFGEAELSVDTMECLALRIQDIGIDLPA
ncbi:MAG: ribonucleotide-diphosphate reductase subunit beta [Actinomycetota bacterium]|nr:ribonucleotide-diphosphate reductase subunit beta [Actinomycetota bacterium]